MKIRTTTTIAVVFTILGSEATTGQMVLPRSLEVALAESALPAGLRSNATIYAFQTGEGMVKVREGTNGFHAMVARVDPAVFRATWEYTVHPSDVVLPIAFDSAGAIVNGPIQPFLDASRLIASGTSPSETKRIIRSRYDSGQYVGAARPGVSYMMSPVLRAYPTPLENDRVVTISVPHTMFYASGVSMTDVGGAGPRSVGQTYIIQEGVHGYMGMRLTADGVAEVVAEHTDLLKALCQANETLCLPPSTSNEEETIIAAALAMPRAIDHARWDEFIQLFTEDAIMFFPFTSTWATSRAEIESVMRPIFTRNAERLPGPLFGFNPENVQLRMLGHDGAAVSWDMRSATTLSRRTAVVRREAGQWKIAVVHADNRQLAPS